MEIKNVEGILWCDKDGKREVVKIEKCDMAFVFAFSNDKGDVDVQAVTLGGMQAGYAIKGLARAAADRMGSFFDDPAKDFKAMRTFEKEFHGRAMEFMISHLPEILSEKGGE